MPIIIKNGLIYDGSGRAPFKSDILIQNDRIARVGTFNQKNGLRVIDAGGAIVTPGFIDINTSADRYFEIFSGNFHEKFIREGVTTIIGGNDGISLAPLTRGSLDLIHQVGEIKGFNINWRNFREFIRSLKSRKIGVNFGTLIGHTTLHRAVVGEALLDPTDSEMSFIRKILTDALRDGAFGLSLGLNNFYSKQIHNQEILDLLGILKKNKGVYAITLNNIPEKIIEIVQELIALVHKTGVNTEFHQLKPLKGSSEIYLVLKDLIEKETANVNINFDCNPLGTNFVSIYQFLPAWVKNDNLPTILNYLRTTYFKNRLLSHFKNYNYDDLVIAWMPSQFHFLVGKTVEQFALNAKIKTPEAILKLMVMSNLKATLYAADIDLKVLEQFILSPISIISSDGINLDQKNLKVFSGFIEWAKNQKDFGLEKAFAKVTGSPAQKYMIKNRGLIKENYYADILVLRDDHPTDVLINGQAVLVEGKIQKALAGSVLLKNR